MEDDPLSLKYKELSDDLERIGKAIRIAKYSDVSEIKDEIRIIEKETADKDLSMRVKMRLSKAKPVESISKYYEKERKNYLELRRAYNEYAKEGDDERADHLLLISEYALDFAIQVVNEALLISLKAIEQDKERL